MDVITTAIYGALIRAAGCVDALASLNCTVTHVEVGGGRPRIDIDAPCPQLSQRATLRRQCGPDGQVRDVFVAEPANCMVSWTAVADVDDCRVHRAARQRATA